MAALTSTQFMTAPGGFNDTTLIRKLDKIDCSQVLSAVLLADKALLGHIKMGPVATNIEVNWIEDELNPAYIVASSSATNKVTLVGTWTSTSLIRVVRKYSILQPANAEWAVQVTSSTGSATTLTVANYGSTVWASVSNTKLYIIAAPYADISDASDDRSQSRTKRRNFMQVFEKAVAITQTRKNMDMEAIVDELQTQIKYRTMEIKRELDISVIRGFAKATASNTFSADTELRTMAGIIQLIRDYDLDTTNEDDMVIQASAALTQGLINSLAYKIYQAGGLDETADPIIVVGAKQARIIAAMEKELRRVEQGERQVGYYRDIFLSDLGVEMPIVIDRWMPTDKLLILDRSRMMLRPMAGDAWHIEQMAKTGRSEKWQISGQYTLDFRCADKCHGMMYDLS
jgi:hypothetical protein